MAPWLTSKLVRSKAFTNNGLDYFGPLCIKKGKDGVKVCVCTCITTWAIYVKLAEDMTAEQFLSALRRFIVRGGKPDQIILDKVPHFKVTKNEVDVASKKAVNHPSVHCYITD